jgi:hypothetical protein
MFEKLIFENIHMFLPIMVHIVFVMMIHVAHVHNIIEKDNEILHMRH